jgi:hypothetical protein
VRRVDEFSFLLGWEEAEVRWSIRTATILQRVADAEFLL